MFYFLIRSRHPYQFSRCQSHVMADLYVKEIERKLAHYEAIMSRCPQCKTSLPTPEAEPAIASSRQSRSNRSGQQPNASPPPPTLTVSSRQSQSTRSAQHLTTKPLPPTLAGPSNQPAPISALSSSAQASKTSQPASQKEPRVRNIEKDASTFPPAVRSGQDQQGTEARISDPRHPPRNLSSHPKTTSTKPIGSGPSREPPVSSQSRSVRPPGLEIAGGRQHTIGELFALASQLRKKPDTRKQIAKWERAAEIMLEEVPIGRYWRKELSKMDSSIIAAVAMSEAPIGYTSSRKDAEHGELIQLVQRFAQRHSAGRLHFQQFILVCLCKVLSCQGVPKEKIVETLQICVSDTRKENIDRYLKGVTWANKMINDLFITDWGYRAVDLIVICKTLEKPLNPLLNY